MDPLTAADDFDSIGNSADPLHPLRRCLGQLLLVVGRDTAPEHDDSSLDFDLNVTKRRITGGAESPPDSLDRGPVRVGFRNRAASLRGAEIFCIRSRETHAAIRSD